MKSNNHSVVSAGVAILIVLAVYGWFIAIGPWRERGYTSDYYSRLASAFQNGQLALEEKPDPALLALPDPYDHKARKGIPLLGDASLYEGNYYLYFGAFPSLVLAVITALIPAQVGDQYIAYFFIIGLFLIQCLLFLEVVRQFFSGLPGPIIALVILLLGLTGPSLRMLSHPYIHEAAIAGGQCLFTIGFYFAFQALKTQPIRAGKLFLAGLFWSFAAATRITQLVPIAWMVVLIWLFVAWKDRADRSTPTLRRATAALIGPLAVCGLALAWYNWARFDSIFEFGLYYQLAAFHLQANYDIVFSRVYLLQNLYNYFLNPFELNGSFPFFHALPGTEKPVLASIELPSLYAVEGRFAGALISTPFLLFSIVPVIQFITALVRSSAWEQRVDGFAWTVLGLAGSSLAGALPSLLLFYVGYRYETEFVASLTLLALIGFCQSHDWMNLSLRRYPIRVAGIGLAVFSLLANLGLSYSGLRG